MSIFGIFAMYLGYCLVNKPWKLLSKPGTDEEKNEYQKLQNGFIFFTGFFLIMAFFFNPIVRQFFLGDLGWSSVALFILNVLVLAIFFVVLVRWERKRKIK